MATTAPLEGKSFDSPDETRPFVDKGKADIVTVGGVDIGRGTFEPGWRWSEHVKPLAGTDSCQAAHTGYVVSGRMVVRMDGGEEREFGPGDVFYMPPRPRRLDRRRRALHADRLHRNEALREGRLATSQPTQPTSAQVCRTPAAVERRQFASHLRYGCA